MSIRQKLIDKNIYLNDYSLGKHQTTCPFCSDKRKKKHNKVFAVWIENGIATYNCIHCGEHGFVVEKDFIKKDYTLPNVAVKDNLGEKAKQFFNNRSINIETAKKMGVYIESKFGKPMIAYPYFKNGLIVNVKYRGVLEKTFTQETNGEPVLYNYDNCFSIISKKNAEKDKDPNITSQLIIVEGENDCLAMIEAGFENVVSVPAGSIGKEIDKEDGGKKFDFIKNSQPLIDICDKFVLALDNDEAGQCMTKALIDRLGRGKCKIVDWGLYDTPTPCKDANDFLKLDKDIIVDAISLAKPLPLRGIVRCNDDIEEFEDYLRYGTLNAISTGFENLDKYIKFELGNFITITGYPGSGKSQFMTNLILNLAKNYGFKTLFCAFENSVKQLKKKWCQMLIGCPTVNANEELIEELRKKTYGFMNEYFYPLQDFTNNLNIDNILEIAEESIQMYGIKCVVIDPFNKIGYTKTNNITEDIGSVLNKITAFAKRNNVLVFLVAHPTKPAERKISKAEVPSGFDIAGSANFLNMSDVVLTVYRNQDDEASKSKECKVMVSKVRDNDYGQEGSAYFKYNTYSGIYQEIEKTQFKEKKHNEDF